MSQEKNIINLPPEKKFARELDALKANDKYPAPEGWQLSPRMVKMFIVGSDEEVFSHKWKGKKTSTVISKKYYGDNIMVERAIITLAGNRGLILVGEPGTAKTMLSELLSAAISGDSTNTIQGTAGTTEDQIKYSWNYSLLINEGPSLNSLVPAPLYMGMKKGIITRFEEITRCPHEIQDTMVSILSDKHMIIPELKSEERVLFAKKGFNVIATANTRDRGVNEMSSALKRRLNFETVYPISDINLEMKVVKEQTKYLLSSLEEKVNFPDEVMELLVTAFHEMRQGYSREGTKFEKPGTIMSTAEAVSAGFSAALHACYYGDGTVSPSEVANSLVGSVIKDSRDDIKRFNHYFDFVVKPRGKEKNVYWQEFYKARKFIR